MGSKSLNDEDRFLLNNWTDARLLERSMNTLRDRYKQILGMVLSEAQRRHTELDCRGMVLEIDEDADDQRDTSNIGLGKRAWSSNQPRRYPTGLWINGISLGEIAKSVGKPAATVWIYPRENSKLDFQNITNRLRAEAKRQLRGTDVRGTNDKYQAYIEYSLPESRKRLIELLLKNASEGFIECLVRHFDNLAKFVPILDDLLGVDSRKRQA